jgi:hypothetical protein
MEVEELVSSLVRHSAFIAVGRLLSYLLVPTCLSACSGGSAVSTDRASSSDNLWSIVFHSYVTCLAAAGAWELGFSPAARWEGRSELGALAGLLICADNLCQLPVQFAKNVPLSKSWTVLAHHVAQTGTFLLALHTGRCHFWCAPLDPSGTAPRRAAIAGCPPHHHRCLATAQGCVCHRVGGDQPSHLHRVHSQGVQP